MRIDERVTERLSQLVAMGERVLATQHSQGAYYIGDLDVDYELAYQWATSAQSLLARVFGPESEHYKNFVAQLSPSLSYSPAVRAQGVLKAANDDYVSGQL